MVLKKVLRYTTMVGLLSSSLALAQTVETTLCYEECEDESIVAAGGTCTWVWSDAVGEWNLIANGCYSINACDPMSGFTACASPTSSPEPEAE